MKPIFFLLLSTILSLPAIGQNAVSRYDIYALDYSPDGSMLAVAGGANFCGGDDDLQTFAIHILSSATHEVLYSLEGHHCAVNEVDWSPSSDRLVSSSSDGSVRIWNVQAEQQLAAFGATAAGVEHSSFQGASWNPAGAWVASYEGIAAILIDPIHGDAAKVLITEVSQEPHFLTSISWSPDGNTLAAGTAGDTIQFWDVRTNEAQLEPTLTISNISARSIAWNPRGNQLAVGGRDGMLRLLNVTTGNVLPILEGHTQAIIAVQWDATGERIATGSRDQTIRVWDLATEETIKMDIYTGSVYAVSWQPNHDTVAFGGEGDASGDATVKFLSLGAN
jgi:WD40 repeat protein